VCCLKPYMNKRSMFTVCSLCTLSSTVVAPQRNPDPATQSRMRQARAKLTVSCGSQTAMDDIQSETAPTPFIFTPSTEPALPTEMADAGNLESHALKPGTPPADTAAEYQGFLQPEDDDIPPLDLPFTPNRSSLSVERLGGASTTAAAANDDKTDPPVATSTADDDDKTDPSVATSTADDDDKTDPPVAGSAALGLGSAVLPALPARKPKARKTAPPPLPAATTAAAVPVLSRKQQRLSNRRAMMQSMLDHMQQEQPPPVPPPLPPANTGPSEDVEVGQVPGQAESAALLEAVRRSVGSRYVALVSCVAWTLRGYVWLREYAAALDRLSVQQLRRTTLAATTDATLARDPLLTQLLAHASLGPNQLIADAELCTAVCQLHDKPGHLLDLVLHAYFAIHHARDEAPHPPDRTALLGIMATADAMSVRAAAVLLSFVDPAPPLPHQGAKAVLSSAAGAGRRARSVFTLHTTTATVAGAQDGRRRVDRGAGSGGARADRVVLGLAGDGSGGLHGLRVPGQSLLPLLGGVWPPGGPTGSLGASSGRGGGVRGATRMGGFVGTTNASVHRRVAARRRVRTLQHPCGRHAGVPHFAPLLCTVGHTHIGKRGLSPSERLDGRSACRYIQSTARACRTLLSRSLPSHPGPLL
jgi:hypothetical protein